MKLYVYRSHVTNFGDELNDWLMPQVFPDFFDENPDPLFLGIGSILFDSHPKEPLKIVFGSGYGGYTPLPEFDGTWRIYCVRGPRTAQICGLDPSKVAGDTAILINRKRPPVAGPKRFRCSFMPHWQSIDRGNWQEACRLAGVHFIDPRHPVIDVLAEIQQSEMVVAEAMHGAIVSDALRVPWVPIMPLDPTHRMKWFDWAEALDITLKHRKISASRALEAGYVKYGRERQKLKDPRGIWKPAVALADTYFVRKAASGLKSAMLSEPSLSSDLALDRAIDKLETHADQIRRDFPGR